MNFLINWLTAADNDEGENEYEDFLRHFLRFKEECGFSAAID